MFLDVLFRHNFELDFAMSCTTVDPRDEPIDYEPMPEDDTEESDIEQLPEPVAVAGAKRKRDAEDELGASEEPEPEIVKYDTLPDGCTPNTTYITGPHTKVTVLEASRNPEATRPKLVPPGVIRDVLKRHCETRKKPKIDPDADEARMLEMPIADILAALQTPEGAQNVSYLCLEVMRREEVATDFAAVSALNIVASTASLITAVNETKRARNETIRRNRITKLDKLNARVAKHNAKIEADGEKANRKTIIARDHALDDIKDLKRLLGTREQ